VQLDDTADILGGNKLALLVGMPWLSALGLGFTTRSFGRAGRCGRRVRGGRLRGVLRVLVEASFQLIDARLELTNCSKEREDEGTYGWWGCLPILR
jgi:hypothetical protein